jgi:hypothetical protein
MTNKSHRSRQRHAALDFQRIVAVLLVVVVEISLAPFFLSLSLFRCCASILLFNHQGRTDWESESESEKKTIIVYKIDKMTLFLSLFGV